MIGPISRAAIPVEIIDNGSPKLLISHYTDIMVAKVFGYGPKLNASHRINLQF